MRELQIWHQSIPLLKPFTIARGTRTAAHFVRCRLTDYDTKISVVSDCVPYAHYGETIESVMGQIESIREKITNNIVRRDNCHAFLPKGAARNAVNCLLWYVDLQLGQAQLPIMESMVTAKTIVIDTPEKMADDARQNRHAPLLKIKLLGENDSERVMAVRQNAPDATIIVDANESLNRDSYLYYLPILQQCHIAMIEQPFRAGMENIFNEIPRPIPIYADEAIHDSQDYKNLGHYYDGINIKLDKTGGLSEAIKLRDMAHQEGKAIMIGCMLGASMAMLPAYLLATDYTKFIDIDGPLWLTNDNDLVLCYSRNNQVQLSKLLEKYVGKNG